MYEFKYDADFVAKKTDFNYLDITKPMIIFVRSILSSGIADAGYL